MNSLIEFWGSPVTGTFVIALLHSLWQGLLWAVLLALALRVISATSANLRYNLACICLFGMVMTFLATWSLLRQSDVPSTVIVTDGLNARLIEPSDVSDTQHATVLEEQEQTHAGNLNSGEGGTITLPVAQNIATPRRWLQHFLPWCAVLWACGAMLMLVRNLSSLLAVRALQKESECEDVRLLALLERVRLRLGLSVPIRLLMTQSLPTPAIWGIVRPVLFLPISLATSLSDQDLEAIFAHELTHVRRYDQVINMLQLVLEACFFFNPAIWWLSHQVRTEREACCDAVAAKLVSGPVHYAEMLANTLLRPLPAPASLLAMSGDGGSLLDRVRRLLLPDYRPAMKLSWWSCGLLLILTCGGLFALYEGTNLAVSLLTDEERIEIVYQQAQVLAPESVATGMPLKIKISGRVMVPADGPPVESVGVTSYFKSGNHSNMNTRERLNGEFKFEYEFGQGETILFFEAPGYSPTLLGPFTPAAGPVIEDQVVTLEQGTQIPIQVVDDQGQPAAGVSVGASIVYHGNGIGFGKTPLVTDEQGQAILEHVPKQHDVSLSLRGPGYQRRTQAVGMMRVAGEHRYTISRAVPASGTIVDEAGQPIAGVEFHELYSRSPGMTNESGAWNDAATVSDAAGQFALTELLDAHAYIFLLRHPNYGQVILRNVTPGAENLRVVLPPGVTVHGQIVLPQDGTLPLTPTTWTARYTPDGQGAAERDVGGRQPPIAVDATGKFTLKHVALGRIALRAGGYQQVYEITEDEQLILFNPQPTSPSAPPAARDVVLRFTHLGQPVAPRGTLTLNGEVRALNAEGQDFTSGLHVPIESGQARFQIRVGSHLSLYDTQGVIGFWFSDHDLGFRKPVDWAESPLQVSIPCYPAGAISGVVLDSDGQPAAGASVSLRQEFSVKPSQSHDGKSHSYGGGGPSNLTTDVTGRFFITPVPLGAKCRVTVTQGFNKEIGDEVVLSARRPTEIVNLQLGPTTDLQLRIKDEHGQPARGITAQLEFIHPQAAHSWLPGAVSDAQGLVTFSGCNLEHADSYRVMLKDELDYIPAVIKLLPKSIAECQLQRGQQLVCTVLDEQGRPVAGVDISAVLPEPADFPDLYSRIESRERTDAQGRYTFNNLPSVPLRISAAGVQTDTPLEMTVKGQQTITIQGRVADWVRRN